MLGRITEQAHTILQPTSTQTPEREGVIIVSGDLVQTTAGKWIIHPLTLDVRTGTGSDVAKYLSVTKAASGTAAGTPSGVAAPVMRRCTGRLSAVTANCPVTAM